MLTDTTPQAVDAAPALDTAAPDPQIVTQALTDAATAAQYAPSNFNTQPWRWRLRGADLDLFVENSRTLHVSDPDGRLAVLSCGAALHHVAVSLAADGWHAAVTRLPNSTHVGHLAKVHVDRRIPAQPAAIRLREMIPLRHTDRRPVLHASVDADKLRSVTAAVESAGTRLHLLRPDQVFALTAAADHALRAEAANPAWQAELQHWTGGTRPTGGVSDAVIPPDTVPGRDFGRRGDVLISPSHDHAAVFAILHGAEDRHMDWLRAGEALSAAWLTATELGISVLPLSAMIEVAATRTIMRHLLDDVGCPYLVLRFSVLNPADAGSLDTPCLSTNQTVEHR